MIMLELDEPDDIPNGSVLFASKKRVAIYHSPYSMYTRDLQPGKYYLILPMSFNCLSQCETFVVTVCTHEAITMVPKTVTAEDAGLVLIMACQRGKRTEPFSIARPALEIAQQAPNPASTSIPGGSWSWSFLFICSAENDVDAAADGVGSTLQGKTRGLGPTTNESRRRECLDPIRLEVVRCDAPYRYPGTALVY